MSPPSFGDNGVGDLGSARGQAEIEVPIQELRHLPAQVPGLLSLGDTSGEDLILPQPGGMDPALAGWVFPVPEGIRGDRKSVV